MIGEFLKDNEDTIDIQKAHTTIALLFC